MTDRASAEGLREALGEAIRFLDHEHDRAHASNTTTNFQCLRVHGALERLRAALRSSESDSGIDVERLKKAMSDHEDAAIAAGFDEHCCDFGCATDIIEVYARRATPRTETSDD